MRLPVRLLLLGAALATCAGAADSLNFITRRGDRLYDGDREFRWVSVNAPDVLQSITNYRFEYDYPAGRYRLPDEYEIRDCIRSVHQLGGRVLRAFVITVRREPHPAVFVELRGNDVVLNEAALAVFDRLLQVCNEEGVRLIVPLVGFSSGIRGDTKTYPDFWTVGSNGNRQFKEVIRQLFTRTNPLTGVAYRDDPAILGWQTGNELEIGPDPVRRAWLHDIAAYIKSLDSHHLLIDGRNRPTDIHGLYDEFADDPNLDVLSYHTYGNLPGTNSAGESLRIIRQDLRGRKPILITEIAMTTPPDKLRALLDEIVASGIPGANWWALRFHNRDGGFYKHSDAESQFEDLNWPGFTQEPAAGLPEIAREREILGILRDYAAKISGQPAPAPTAPAAPVMLPAADPGHLTWRGSTGADAYDLQRAEHADGPWLTLHAGMGDHLIAYAPLACDTGAETGRDYFYRVIAHNAGGPSAPSNVIGPVRSDRRWLVDEYFDRSVCAADSANVAINLSYAHTRQLEDIGLAQRAQPKEDAKLVYEVPGAFRSFRLTVFAAQTLPRFFRRDAAGQSVEITPQVTRPIGLDRALCTAELPADSGGRLEIVLPAAADPQLALGRLELSWTPHR